MFPATILLWYNYNSWQDTHIRNHGGSWMKRDEILSKFSLWLVWSAGMELKENLRKIGSIRFEKLEQELNQSLDRAWIKPNRILNKYQPERFFSTVSRNKPCWIAECWSVLVFAKALVSPSEILTRIDVILQDCKIHS